MAKLGDYYANGVEVAGMPRPDIDELVDLIPAGGGTMHLAILQQPYLDLIADGTKTIESRFNTKRAAPFGKIAVGDLVLLKEPGKPVTNYFFAAAVILIDLAEEPLALVRQQYGAGICAQNEQDFWQSKADSRYCTLVEVGEKGQITPALDITKKDQRGWVTFTRANDDILNRLF